MAISVAAIVAFGIAGCDMSDHPVVKSEDDKKIEAFVMSQDFVKGRLVSPGSAQFPNFDSSSVVDNGNNSFTVTSTVDSQNAMGGLMHADYKATIHSDGGTSWRSDNVEVNQRE